MPKNQMKPRSGTRPLFIFRLGGLALVCICLSTVNSALAQPAKEPEVKIGKIYVTGNEVTQDRIILHAIGWYPGQTLPFADLRAAENRLIGLGLFETNADKALSIEVLENENGGQFKDVLIRVTEAKKTGSLSLKPCITRMGFQSVSSWRSEILIPFAFPRAWPMSGMAGHSVEQVGSSIGTSSNSTSCAVPCRRSWPGKRSICF